MKTNAVSKTYGGRIVLNMPEIVLAPDTVQDEFAIASILLDMGDYLAEGPSPYPLGDALEDAYFWLLLEQAVKNPWQEISCGERPWETGE